MADGAFGNKDYAEVNFAVASDIIDEWTATVNEYASTYKKASENGTFLILEELGISNGFPKRYDEAMEGYSKVVNSLIKELNDYFEELKNKDDTLAGLVPESPRNDYNNPAGGGAIVKEEKDNLEDQLKFLEKISLDDLSEVLATLKSIALENNMSIDDLLNDETLGDKIKEMILSSLKLSDEYKSLIEEGSSVSLVSSLKSLVNGEVKQAFGLDEDTVLTLKSHLINIANGNKLKYEELLDNQEILNGGLSSMKDVTTALKELNKDNVQSQLQAIYNGDYSSINVKIDDNSQNIIKSQIDIISSLANISYEDLFNIQDYGEELLNSFERLQRTSLYADLLSNCKNASSILSSLIK